jgi:hypothetical protein
MGYSLYSSDNRTLRASVKSYNTASFDTLFSQQKERKIHNDL